MFVEQHGRAQPCARAQESFYISYCSNFDILFLGHGIKYVSVLFSVLYNFLVGLFVIW